MQGAADSPVAHLMRSLLPGWPTTASNRKGKADLEGLKKLLLFLRNRFLLSLFKVSSASSSL
jgi:hypothetical protein